MLGRTIALDTIPHTVLGVMPTEFRFRMTIDWESDPGFGLWRGSTPGATSIEFQANSGGKSYRGLSPGGLGVQFGREWTATFIKSIERLKQLGPWDVLLGNHPFLMPRNLFDIENDLRKRGPGPNPAVLGATVIDEWLDRVLQTAREKLATEQKEPQP